MNRSQAQLTLLVRAVELTDRSGVLLPLAIRDRCTLEARPPAPGAAPPSHPPAALTPDEDAFVARRAELIEADIRHRSPQLAALAEDPELGRQITYVLCALVFGLGLVSESLAAHKQLNLLQFPLLGLILWNFVIYVFLLLKPLLHVGSGGGAGPLVTAFAHRLVALRFKHRPSSAGSNGEASRAGVSAQAAERFLRDWVPLQRPVVIARATTLLHGGAMLLTLGMIAGLVGRGWSTRFLAGWESTWLDAGAVATLLKVFLGPASLLTGIPLPDSAGIQALDFETGLAVGAGHWIVLYGMAAVLYIIIPRAFLLLWSRRGEARLRAGFYAPSRADPYFHQLLQVNRGIGEVAAVLWHGMTPDPDLRARVREALRDKLGGQIKLEFLDPLVYGEESSVAEMLTSRDRREHAVLVFSLAATPEEEIQGELLRQLAAVGPPGEETAPLVLLDAEPLKRFRDDPGFRDHFDDRLRTWERFLAGHRASWVVLDSPSRPDIAPRPRP